MNSAIYKFLIDDLLLYPGVDLGELPLSLTTKQAIVSSDSLTGFSGFLSSLLHSSKTAVIPNLFAMDASTHSFYSTIIIKSHQAIFDILSGAPSSSHPFSGNGIQCTAFLTFAIHDDAILFGDPLNLLGLAMNCFLLEGLMYAGFCKNATENSAKRAAHSYFISLKKAMHHADPADIPFIIGYLWGAYLLGQKTDGIQDSTKTAKITSQNFEWKTDGAYKKYLGIKQDRPLLFSLIPVRTTHIPHPFSRFELENKTGITVALSNQPIIPVELVEMTEINRSKIQGYKFTYKASAGDLSDITWIVAILFMGNTIYRIDTLTLMKALSTESKVAATVKIECSGEAFQTDKDTYIARDHENTVIRFIENPLHFSLPTCKDSIAEFKGAMTMKTGEVSLSMVIAWAKGKGISALFETRLLGIY